MDRIRKEMPKFDTWMAMTEPLFIDTAEDKEWAVVIFLARVRPVEHCRFVAEVCNFPRVRDLRR